MGKIIVKNQPCLDKNCGSSDARQIYEDGTSFCFSCQQFFPKVEGEVYVDQDVNYNKQKKLTIDEIKEYPIRGFKERNITKEVCEFFKVKVSYNTEGEIDTHYYPYDNGNAYKIRTLPKTFKWINKSASLFGIENFQPGGKRIVITEGEIDAMTVAQASLNKYKKIFPVVALSSAVMAHTTLLEAREFLRSFNEVVLCLDNDEAGEKATKEAISIIGIDKVKLCRLPLKDPSEVFTKMGSQALMQCIWDAHQHIPDGFITKDEIWKRMEERNKLPAIPYPACMGGFNKKLKGKRFHEITLFISGTGSGKSTLLRESILCDIETTDYKVGIISFEETPAETGTKLAAMYLNRNPEEEEIPLDELKIGFDAVFDNDRIILLNHEGNFADSSILDKIEYMCLAGCKFIYIDHITILVAEGVGDLSGNEAQDKMMSDLSRVVQRHEVWIGLVSHLRKAHNGGKSFEEGKIPVLDDIKGSGSIKQISYDIIAFARNMFAETEEERNTIKGAVLKARTTGKTGPVGNMLYLGYSGRIIKEPEEITSIE